MVLQSISVSGRSLLNDTCIDQNDQIWSLALQISWIYLAHFPAYSPVLSPLFTPRPMYELADFGDPWDYWSVHASADKSKANHRRRFGGEGVRRRLNRAARWASCRTVVSASEMWPFWWWCMASLALRHGDWESCLFLFFLYTPASARSEGD